MPTFEFDMPDGTKKRLDGTTAEEAWGNFHTQQAPQAPAAPQPASPSSEGLGTKIARGAIGMIPGVGGILGPMLTSQTGRDIMAGGLQGVALDPVEELGSMVEHLTGTKLAPDFIRNRLKSFRSGVEQSEWGPTARIAGAVGSAFIPFGGEVGALARLAGRAREIERAGEAGYAAVKSAMGAERAGPAAYAAVRDAVLPGEKARRGVAAALREPDVARPIGGAVQDWRTGGALDRLGAVPEAGGPRAANVTPLRPSTAAAAKRHVVPPELPVGPPTLAERARLAASDAKAIGPAMAARLAREHPVAAAMARGAGSAVLQPNEGGDPENYWKGKAAQATLGALTAGLPASEFVRKAGHAIKGYAPVGVPAWAASAALHSLGGPVAALGSYPLHHLAYRHARQAVHAAHGSTPGRVAKALRHPGSQRAAGVAAGRAVGEAQGERLYIPVEPTRE